MQVTPAEDGSPVERITRESSTAPGPRQNYAYCAAAKPVRLATTGENRRKFIAEQYKLLKVNQPSVISIQERGAINAKALIPPRFDPESGENVSVQRGKMRKLYAGAKGAGAAARAHAAVRDLALAGGLLRLIRP